MKRIFIVAMALVSGFTVKGQNSNDVDKYKSLFTINFIRYVDWPEASKQGDFVIGILKNGSLAKLISTQTAGKKFAYQNIIVKEFNSVEEITNCQILYVSQGINLSKNFATVAAKLKQNNSLIITESNNAISDGSMINFVIRDQKLKFEISESNAQAFGLGFSNSLTAMANAIRM